MYAYSVGGDSGEPRAGLIYPATKSISGPALFIKPLAGAKPARIRGAGIDVPAALDEIGTPAEDQLHERIRATIGEVTGLLNSTPTLSHVGQTQTTITR